MAWLSAIIVIRDAPGSPEDFLGSLLSSSNVSDSMNTYVNISVVEPGDTMCTTVYNITEEFPSCDISRCVCENGSFVDVYSCLPTVDCLYGNGSTENLVSLCSSGFISLIGGDGCKFGTLNNFQVLAAVIHFNCMVVLLSHHAGNGNGVRLGTTGNCWYLCCHNLFSTYKSCQCSQSLSGISTCMKCDDLLVTTA